MKGKAFLLVLPAISGVMFAIDGPTLLFFIIMITALIFSLFHFLSSWKLATAVLTCVFVFFYVWAAVYDETNKTALTAVQKETKLSGTISSIPKVDGDLVTFRLKVPHKEKVQVVYYVESEKELQEMTKLKAGMSCSFNGELIRPSPATNFYGFDYRRFLYFERIHWLIRPHEQVSSTCISSSASIANSLQQWRQKGITHIQETFDMKVSGIVIALIFGERYVIEEDVLAAYQSLGLVHLLAVSGLHVGLITGTLYYVLIRLGLTKENSLHLLLAILPVYMVLAGAAPSVLRASFTTMIVMVCIRLNYKIHPLDGISFVLLLLISYNPYYVYHIGFQLSFLISYGLVISGKTLLERYETYWQKLFVVTFISQLLSLPLILFHFYEFSILALPLNFIYIPLLSLFILPGSFFTFLLSFFSPQLASFVIPFFTTLVNWSHQLLLRIDGQSLFQIRLGQPHLLVLTALLLAIMFFFLSWENKGTVRAAYSSFLCICTVLLTQYFIPYVTPIGTITMLDVGQGDSILVELPFRKEVLLIDTGGAINFRGNEEWRKRKREFNTGEDIVLPYLKARGIRTIDKLILTHGHYDHIGGVEGLIGRVKIKEVLYSKGQIEGEFERKLLQKLHQTGSKITFVSRGDRWQAGDSHFYILSPNGKEESLNNRSIVLLARLGMTDWLFTGDLEEAGEMDVIKQFPALKVDILKAGHHGSRTSSTERFLEHISPKVVLVSAGRNNRFGHPHQEVLSRYDAYGINLFRTDKDGAIRYHYRKSKQFIEAKMKK